MSIGRFIADVRFWAAFAVLFAYCFGMLSYGFYLIVTGESGLALGVVALVVIGGKLLPRPLAWLATVGQRASNGWVVTHHSLDGREASK